MTKKKQYEELAAGLAVRIGEMEAELEDIIHTEKFHGLHGLAQELAEAGQGMHHALDKLKNAREKYSYEDFCEDMRDYIPDPEIVFLRQPDGSIISLRECFA